MGEVAAPPSGKPERCRKCQFKRKTTQSKKHSVSPFLSKEMWEINSYFFLLVH